MTEAERHAPHIVGTKFYTQAEAEALVTKERAAIVEWLRDQSAQSETPETGFVIARMALCIEECDHHKEDSKHG